MEAFLSAEAGEWRPVCLVGNEERGGRPSKWGEVRWRASKLGGIDGGEELPKWEEVV